MKPYFEDSAVTIYHGDCREILPDVAGVDLVLTDPPYGHGWRGINSEAPGGRNWTRRRAEAIEGHDTPFDPSFLLGFPDVVLFGANHYADKLPPSAAWFVWDKRDGTAVNNLSDCEMAWSKRGGSARLYRHMWNGLCRDSEIGEHLHPTQKPIALMKWVLGFFPDATTVLDPYMGAGSVLRAAKDLGRKAIGIEIEGRYCEIAAKRMAQEVLL